MLNINIWDSLWAVIDFFLLYFVLKKLLFDPLLRFMEERKARVEAGLNAQREAQAAAETKNGELAAAREDCLRESRRILDRVRAEDEALSSQQSARLKQESAQTRKELHQELQRQWEQNGQILEERQAELAAVLADRLLSPDGQQNG